VRIFITFPSTCEAQVVPSGIILSGSPYSVYDKDAPRADPAIFDETQNDVPVLGICYGLQEMSRYHGAVVTGSDHREYGKAVVTVQRDHTEEAKKGGFEIGAHVDQFFEGVEGELPVSPVGL
jgi:GMP synthase (glutamine-hydrolysing)